MIALQEGSTLEDNLPQSPSAEIPAGQGLGGSTSAKKMEGRGLFQSLSGEKLAGRGLAAVLVPQERHVIMWRYGRAVCPDGDVTPDCDRDVTPGCDGDVTPDCDRDVTPGCDDVPT